ncbi:MAG: hypothetical protein HWD60_06620 [Defluviicoccus sp.]|nr:MAG: hypothetical protein HWD60_06620 [Defluviicoccus sp.]
MNADVEAEITEPSGLRGTWMISFVDLISVLLTFMVMLYAISDIRDVPAWHGTDRLSETVDWHRELPTRAARNGAKAVHSLPAMDLDYLEGVLAATLADEPVRPMIFRHDNRVIVALRLRRSPRQERTCSRRSGTAPAPHAGTPAEHHWQPAGSVRTDSHDRIGRRRHQRRERNAICHRLDGWRRTRDGSRANAGRRGLERPVGSYGLADQPVDRVPVGTQDRHQSPASRLQVVVLAGAAK